MKLSEKIGAVFEILLSIAIRSRGYEVARNSSTYSGNIRGDLLFTTGDKDYLVFLTHTVSHGMTNRKFYRSFEELAQRRISDYNSICIDVRIIRNKSEVRQTQIAVFESIFDGTYYLTNELGFNLLKDFISCLPKIINEEVINKNIALLDENLRKDFEVLADKIISTNRNSSNQWSEYWKLESNQISGQDNYNTTPKDVTSVKLGLKLLSLAHDYPEVAYAEDCEFYIKKDYDDHILDYLYSIGIIIDYQKTLTGIKVKLNPSAFRASVLIKEMGISTEKNWFNEYLDTRGARNLYNDIINPAETKAKFDDLNFQIGKISSRNELFQFLLDRYNDESVRFDSLDILIRATQYSQNLLSSELSRVFKYEVAGAEILVRQIIAKSEDLESRHLSADGLLGEISDIIWKRFESNYIEVSWDDFYQSRVQTYLTHPYVNVHMAVLNGLRKGRTILKNRKESVLPRIASLPSRSNMAVQANMRIIKDGIELFITSISTPDKSHHKHKEFGGKIRAIRYEFDQSGLSPTFSRYIALIDGEWSENQISTLVNSGWEVYSWDSFINDFL